MTKYAIRCLDGGLVTYTDKAPILFNTVEDAQTYVAEMADVGKVVEYHA